MPVAHVHRLSMRHPGDVSALQELIRTREIDAASIVAVIGKTEGNGGVNDFTRGYFTQSLMLLLGSALGVAPADVQARVPCVLSGGTEGVLTPHYLVFCKTADRPDATPAQGGALAVGVRLSAPMPAEAVGRAAQIQSVADAVAAAMADAGIASVDDVQFVQVKCPCVTVAKAQDAERRGATPISADPNRSMAYARAAGAMGVALALGEVPGDASTLAYGLLADFTLQSPRASISSGVEVECNEVIVLGHSPAWTGPLRIACRQMDDALDIGAVVGALDDLQIAALPQVSAADMDRIRGVLVKCEPDRRGTVRGQRHTMLDDTDIHAQRHVRGALGGLVAGVLGDTRIFVSGGAEHQGPDGGGLIAVIAEVQG